eukprot:GILJ01012272.1.p1 GENE.GILJ01012272.1~~GILJ01012272.1.p1  ORF type:complete len:1880 (+),score=353.95 GILJ01012272.1:536-5641(+)
MEAKGLQPDQVLVRGIATGVAEVTVRLDEEGYQSVPYARVTLAVTEPFLLEPSETVYVMPSSVLHYRIMRIKGSQMIRITLPSPIHRFVSSNTTVATVDAESGELNAVELGYSLIQVTDTQIAENEATGSVHVVLPTTVALRAQQLNDSMLPTESELNSLKVDSHQAARITSASNWYLIRGQSYLVEIELFDDQLHELTLPENGVFRMSLNDDILKTVETSSDGARAVLRADRVGSTTLEGQFLRANQHGIGRGFSPSSPLRTAQLVQVSEPLTVLPASRIRLPWVQTSSGVSYFGRLQLFVNGGTGEVEWVSRNKTVAAVTAKGVVFAKSLGVALIEVHDRFNPANRVTVEVEVAAVGELYFESVHEEVQVLEKSVLLLGARDIVGRPFHNCSGLPVEFAIADMRSVALDGPLPYLNRSTSSVCLTVAVTGIMEGVTSVYGTMDSLVVSKRLFVFPPVKLVLPPNPFASFKPPADSILVTLDSSVFLGVEGGPLPWPDETRRYRQRLLAEDPHEIEIEQSIGSEVNQLIRGFSLRCVQLGEQTLSIQVGNEPSSKHPYPRTINVTVSFSCQPPHTLQLVPLSMDTLTELVSRSDPTLYFVRTGGDVLLRLVAMDNMNRVFHNFSSLDVQWSVNPLTPQLASVSATEHSDQKLIHAFHTEGTLTVTAEVSGYKLSREVNWDGIFKRLSTVVMFRIAPDILLQPFRHSLFFHPLNSLSLRCFHGSGRADFSLNDTSLATLDEPRLPDATYESTVASVLHPLRRGVVNVTAIDVGLEGSHAASAVILISRISELLVNLQSDQLQVGHRRSIFIEPLDEQGLPFSEDEFRLMSVSLLVDNADGLRVLSTESTRELILQGVAVGTYQIQAVAVNFEDGRYVNVTSDWVLIHVFPGLILNQDRLHLMPGAQVQLSAQGGPKAAQILYTVNNSTVAVVDKAGVLSALTVGAAVIRIAATAVDRSALVPRRTDSRIDSANAEPSADLVLCELLLPLDVTLVSTIELQQPSRVLTRGGESRLLAVPRNSLHQTFSLAAYPMHFHWQIHNWQILAVMDRLNDTDTKQHLYDIQSPAVTVKALEVGDATVSVRVKVTQQVGKEWIPVDMSTTVPTVVPPVYLEASIKLHVLEPLILLHESTHLLLPLGSALRLRTNFDGVKPLVYRLEPCSSSLVCAQPAGSSLIQVSGDGVVAVGRSGSGEAVVSILCESDQQEVLVSIEVKPAVSVALLSTVPLSNLPLGSSTELRLQLKDDLGRPFTSVEGLQWFTALSHLDPIHLSWSQEGNLIVHAAKVGGTMLQVSLQDAPHIRDIFKVEVQTVVRPESPLVLHLGGHVKFKTSADATFVSSAGRWFSENVSILRMHSKTGDAEALQTGKTTVHFNGSISTHSSVWVARVSQVQIDFRNVPNGKLTNQPPHGHKKPLQYRLPLRFMALDLDTDRFVPFSVDDLIDHRIEVQCKLADAHQPWATTWADKFNGPTVCVVAPRIRGVNQMSESVPRSLTLFVTVYDLVQSYQYESIHSLPFEPAFTMSHADDKIHLSMDNRTTTFLVHGATDTLEVSTEDFRKVAIQTRHNGSTDTMAVTLTVPLTAKPFAQSSIKLHNPVNGQTETVHVAFTPHQEDKLRHEEPISADWLWMIAAISVMIGAFYLFRSSQPLPSRATAAPVRVNTPLSAARTQPGSASPRAATPLVGSPPIGSPLTAFKHVGRSLYS